MKTLKQIREQYTALPRRLAEVNHIAAIASAEERASIRKALHRIETGQDAGDALREAIKFIDARTKRLANVAGGLGKQPKPKKGIPQQWD